MAREAVGRPPGVGEGEPRRRIAGVEDVNLLGAPGAANTLSGCLGIELQGRKPEKHSHDGPPGRDNTAYVEG